MFFCGVNWYFQSEIVSKNLLMISIKETALQSILYNSYIIKKVKTFWHISRPSQRKSVLIDLRTSNPLEDRLSMSNVSFHTGWTRLLISHWEKPMSASSHRDPPAICSVSLLMKRGKVGSDKWVSRSLGDKQTTGLLGLLATSSCCLEQPPAAASLTRTNLP